MNGDNPYYVYILTNRSYSSLYTGITNDLKRRVRQHRDGVGSRFTSRNRCGTLVYYERTGNLVAAMQREREIKLLNRAKKNALVESLNPSWVDLLDARFPPAPPGPSRTTTRGR